MHLNDEEATLALGASLAAALSAHFPLPTSHSPLVIYLCGDLGAGKTTLVRGLLRALGHGGKVKSPTYTLVELYTVSNLNLYHFDFYRLNQPEEYLDAGLDEYFQGSGVCLVEWPDKAAPYVAAPDLRLELVLDGAGRQASLRAESGKGASCLSAMRG
ncbi:MAG: tRNA (adenosine(37)-N6)-threonylcarbamoyltransferase complex ATPase subunit type 1 TsaE [Rhodocyclaceae bacterium]|nr:tRNA (adenosine(37)-N6)-threonylcarbamoyltransferase complex ATPase subunit type 1 TsaE [Rhodocyclaceae bacterium]